MEYWQKQSVDAPLFEDILWSRPETKHGAGKLLIIGGNLHGFAAVGEAYAAAEKGGAGTIRLVLPDSLRKTVGPLGPYEFAPSTPSGSFARDALSELLIGAHWADMILLAGDFGRNSETAILLENFVTKYQGPLVVTGDSIDYFYTHPQLLSDREQTAVAPSISQLQKFTTALKFETPILHDMGLMLLVQALHNFSQTHMPTILTKELDSIVVANDGKVSSTKTKASLTAAAASATVLWMQNPSKPYESITSALVV